MLCAKTSSCFVWSIFFPLVCRGDAEICQFGVFLVHTKNTHLGEHGLRFLDSSHPLCTLARIQPIKQQTLP